MALPEVQDPITVVTTQGATLLARQALGDLTFVPTHFALGDYGFDPDTPQHPISVEADSTALSHELYRAPIDKFEAPTDSVLAVICRVSPNTIRISLGEIGVFVTLTAVKNPYPLRPGGPVLHVGDVFLFGLSHTALRCISYDDSMLHVMTFAL